MALISQRIYYYNNIQKIDTNYLKLFKMIFNPRLHQVISLTNKNMEAYKENSI